MKSLRFGLGSLLVLAGMFCLPTFVVAVERYQDFVGGLREREYYDTALEYLESIEQRADLAPDFKKLLPYEKAATLIQQAKQQRNPDTANATLDRASLFLQQFLKDNPDHPLAAKANSDAASVLVGKGRVAIIQSKNPSNANKKTELIRQAQQHFAAAKAMYDKAYEQHLAAWKKFPVHIDQNEKREEYEARGEAERAYIRAALDAAIVLYEGCQAFEHDTPEFTKAIGEAFTKFEEIHAKHRTQVAGLYARMYQGKCFEEQNKIDAALGIYKELLDHPAETAVLRNLQSQVMHFKLICLNSDTKKDYALVDQLAREWVKDNSNLTRSRFGIGIRFEQARALESLSKGRELKEEQKKQYLQEALTVARLVNRAGGEFAIPSQTLIQKLNSALNRDGADPKDFEGAFGMGREHASRIKEMREKIAGAKPEEKKTLEREFHVHLEETARLLNLALTLRKPDSKIPDVNAARYYLCYVYYLQQRSYESAILGEFVARRYVKDEEAESLPLDSAYMAMAAYAQAYNAKNNVQKDADINHMIGICNFIAANWPDSPRSIEAKMLLGDMYSRTKQPAEAGKWYLQVPESAGQYLDAQLKAGQAYWAAYLENVVKPEGQRPDAKQLADWQTQAQTILKKAIGTMEGKLAENEVLPENLAFAKLTLAQMANATQQYKEAIALLETGMRPVLPLTVLKEGETTRPPFGISSATAVIEIYKQLLRAYIGEQNLENARKAMTELEKVAAGQKQDILPIYIALGKQFKEELDRLAKSNAQQYQAVQKSFEQFLSSMLAKTDGQTYSSLAWIGEVYMALGDGTTDKAGAAKSYGEASKAFKLLVEKAKADAKFCTPDQLLISRTRLVMALRKAGEYEQAATLVKELLATRANSLETQTEAAYVYQDWADAGRADSNKQWAIATLGDKAVKMWGWAELSTKLYQQMSSGAAKERYKELFLESRYNIAYCRHREADGMSDKKRLTQLSRAQTDIVRTTMQFDLDEAWYDKFNQLYRRNMEAMGQIPQDLSKNPEPIADSDTASPGENVSPSPIPEEKKKITKKKVAGKTKNQIDKAAKSAESSSMMMFGIVFGLAVVVGGGIFFMSGKKKPKAMAKTLVAPAAEKPAAKPASKPAATASAKPAPKPGTKPPAKS